MYTYNRHGQYAETPLSHLVRYADRPSAPLQDRIRRNLQGHISGIDLEIPRGTLRRVSSIYTCILAVLAPFALLWVHVAKTTAAVGKTPPSSLVPGCSSQKQCHVGILWTSHALRSQPSPGRDPARRRCAVGAVSVARRPSPSSPREQRLEPVRVPVEGPNSVVQCELV